MGKIQIKRGLKANLPTLDVGELAFCTDTKELFIGTATGNFLIQKNFGELLVSKEPFEGNSDYTKTFSENMDYFVISNDGNSDLSFKIDGKTFYVAANSIFEQKFNPFSTVDIFTTVPYRAYGKKISNDDVSIGDFVALDSFSGNSTITKSFSYHMRELEINNVGNSDLTITINGDSYTVKSGEDFEDYFDPFTDVTVNATSNFYAYVKGLISEIVVDSTPPANTSSVTTSNITASGLTLNWTAVGDIDLAGYNVYQDGVKLNGSIITDTTYVVSTLSASTTYTFKVTSIDINNNESTGTTKSETTSAPPDIIPPADTDSVSASSITDTSLILNWNAVGDSDLAGYNVYQDGAKLNSSLVIVTNYSVNGLTASTTYTFKVTSVDTNGNESIGKILSQATAADITPPNPVTNLQASTPTSSNVPISWDSSSSIDVANYEVAYSTDNFVSDVNIASSVVNPSSTSYVVTGLNSNTSYAIRVVAIDGSGNRSTGVTTTAKTDIVTGTKALSFNGTSDYLKMPSITFDSVEIVMSVNSIPATSSYIIDATTGQNLGSVYLDSNGVVNINGTNTSISHLYKDDSEISFKMNSLPINTKFKFKVQFWSANADDVNIFSNSSNSNQLNATLYDVKFYNGATVVAHYDFTSQFAGTSVTDLSGNNNIATLHGGTWVDQPTLYVTAIPNIATFNGTTTSNPNVTLTSVGGTTIYYTTDGTIPTTSSSFYSTPLNITSTTKIRTITVDSNNNQSAVQTFFYNKDTTSSNPIFSSLNGISGNYSFNTTADVFMYGSTEALNIYYTTDGTTPTTNSDLFTNKFTINSTTTIKAIAVDLAGNSSPVLTQVYTYDITPPGEVTNISASNIGGTYATLSWTASPDADISSYDIYNGATLVKSVTTTTANIIGLSINSANIITIKSKDKAGNVSTGVQYTVNTTTGTQGLYFEGGSSIDHMITPSFAADNIIVDCVIYNNAAQGAIVYYVDGNPRVSDPFVRSSSDTATFNSGWTSATGFAVDTRITLNISGSSNTFGWVFAARGDSQSTSAPSPSKMIIFGITIKNGGTTVAQYDFTNSANISGSTAIDISGNSKNATIYGTPILANY